MSPTPDELEAARLAELAAAGAPHGLSADEVEAARRTGMDLARYAAIKATPKTPGGRSVAALSAAIAAAGKNGGAS